MKDKRSIGEKAEDVITWGSSKENRKRKEEGKESLEEEEGKRFRKKLAEDFGFGEKRHKEYR